ncbi:hypothetical protein [Thiohalomonas denitrificans]|uniref:hypothetical protein n=1 Tax=Thiohalomonas denitrificans TaxID=415747 RepID=UPI0026EF339E|nr:hypothetical protein [Thiohalomonas denitrificans]
MGNSRIVTKVTGGTSFIRSYDGVTDAKTLPGQTKTSDSPEKSNDAQGSANAAGGRTPGAANGNGKNIDKSNNGKAVGKDKEMTPLVGALVPDPQQPKPEAKQP